MVSPIRSGLAAGGATARTATLRVAESTVPPTSVMCPTPSGSPLALSPALSATEAPGATRAASDGETLKMMSTAPRSATSTIGWEKSPCRPPGRLGDIDLRAQRRVELGNYSGDRSAQHRELLRTTGGGCSSAGLGELGRCLLGIFFRDDTSVRQTTRPFIIALGAEKSRLGALRCGHEWCLLEGNQSGSSTHFLSLRNVNDRDARRRRRAQRSDVPR